MLSAKLQELMITVVKLDPSGAEKIRYSGEIVEYTPDKVVIEATWTLPTKELGYTRFEPGDRFIEYYYTDRWFNIFDIFQANGVRKGWYCNVTQPAQIDEQYIKQIDLFLDVWVNPTGEPLILDEDEFAVATTLNTIQRQGAQRGLQEILRMVEKHEEAFSGIVDS